MSVSVDQATYWIKALQHNLQELPLHPDPVKFLSEQYFLLSLLSQALDGHVTFVGVPVPDEQV